MAHSNTRYLIKTRWDGRFQCVMAFSENTDIAKSYPYPLSFRQTSFVVQIFNTFVLIDIYAGWNITLAQFFLNKHNNHIVTFPEFELKTKLLQKHINKFIKKNNKIPFRKSPKEDSAVVINDPFPFRDRLMSSRSLKFITNRTYKSQKLT